MQFELIYSGGDGDGRGDDDDDVTLTTMSSSLHVRFFHLYFLHQTGSDTRIVSCGIYELFPNADV